MKKSILFIFMAIFFFLGSTAFAAEEMGSHDMKKRHSGRDLEHLGNLIHETDIEGYHLSYRLIDLKTQMKDMQGMQGTGTHHLMLTIHDADKKMVDSAQVGYLVVNPDGSEQKVMTMGMKEGYGADINLSNPGEYTIKCKAAVGEQKLLDEFKYMIESIPSDSNN